MFCVFFSCSTETFQDTESEKNVNESINSKALICPHGYHAVFEYEFDGFNFHRPKHNCESGFWFCVSGHWEIDCEANGTNGAIAISEIDLINNTTTVAAIHNKTNKTVEFYFPKDLASVGKNTLSDFSVFNVDENLKMANGIILKKGNYSSVVVGTEIIITVDTL